MKIKNKKKMNKIKIKIKTRMKSELRCFHLRQQSSHFRRRPLVQHSPKTEKKEYIKKTLKKTKK